MANLPAETVNPKVAEARAALSCWTRGQWKAQHCADILAGVVSSLLAELDQLRLDLAQQAINASTIIEMQKELGKLQTDNERLRDQLADCETSLRICSEDSEYFLKYSAPDVPAHSSNCASRKTNPYEIQYECDCGALTRREES